MKSITASELNDIAVFLNQRLLGLSLRDAIISGNDIFINFEADGRFQWVWIDMNPQSLFVHLRERLPGRIKKDKKPLGLFVINGFKGKKLVSISVIEHFGRMLRFDFEYDHGEGELYFDIILFSQARNFSAYKDDKKVHFLKPKTLEVISNDFGEQKEKRDLDRIYSEWSLKRGIEAKSIPNAKSSDSEEAKRNKVKKKLRSAIKKVTQLQVELDSPEIYLKLGQFLLENQSLVVPKEYIKYIDANEGLGANIEFCFEKAKQLKKKKQGAKSRLEQLQLELEALEKRGHSESVTEKSNLIKPQLMNEANIRGRRWVVADKYYFNIGKNGKDNLALLRKAKPWHIWFHLKDFPGVHGILECNKSSELTAKEMREAGEALVQKQFQNQINKMRGDKFAIVYAQCRYVKPLKGQTAGKVSYVNEKLLIVTLN